jgi:hypothetical protein
MILQQAYRKRQQPGRAGYQSQPPVRPALGKRNATEAERSFVGMRYVVGHHRHSMARRD